MRRYSFKDENGGISPGAMIKAVLFILLIGFLILLGSGSVETEVADLEVLEDDSLNVSPEEIREEILDTLQAEEEVILTDEELEEINETLKIIENNPS